MTAYIVTLLISMAIVLLCLYLTVKAFFKNYRGIYRRLMPVPVLMVGCFLAATVLFIPIYLYAGENVGQTVTIWIRSVFRAAYDGARLFIIDGDYQTLEQITYNEVTQQSIAFPTHVSIFYNVFSVLLYVMAPVLTAGFLISFVKNAAAWVRFFLHFRRQDVYVMSCLNERSVILAENIVRENEGDDKKRKSRLVIFADAYEKEDEENSELLERAREIGAICFRKDITKIPLKKPWKYTEKMRENGRRFGVLNENLKTNIGAYYLRDKNDEIKVLGSIREDVDKNGIVSVEKLACVKLYLKLLPEERRKEAEVFLDGLTENTQLSSENQKMLRYLLKEMIGVLKAQKTQRLDIINSLEKFKKRGVLRLMIDTALSVSAEQADAIPLATLMTLLSHGEIPAAEGESEQNKATDVRIDKICKLARKLKGQREEAAALLQSLQTVQSEITASVLTDERIYQLISDKLAHIDCLAKYMKIHAKQKRENHTKLYFIGLNEDENLEQAIGMIYRCREKRFEKRYNVPNMQFYVFARTAESTALLNAVEKGYMKVRRLQEDELLAWQIMQEHSVLEDAMVRDAIMRSDEPQASFLACAEKAGFTAEKPYTPERDARIPLDVIRQKLLEGSQLYIDKPTEMNIAVVGFGDHGREIMKVLCWLGQTAGFDTHIHVFDKQDRMAEKVRAFAPGLIENIVPVVGEDIENVELNAERKENEPHLKLTFYNKTDVNDFAFQARMKSIPEISSVFVALGDDEMNIKTAFLLRQLSCKALGIMKGYLAPSVYAIVYSPEKNQLIREHGTLKTSGLEAKLCVKDGDTVIYSFGEEYNIKFIGGMSERMRLEVLESTALEESAAEAHAAWCESAVSDGVKRLDAESYLNQYEYHRRSSMASALHKDMTNRLPLKKYLNIDSRLHGCDRESVRKEILGAFEHCRWSVYMRTEGYEYREQDKSGLAKTHPLLISYHELNESDQNKDQV